MKTILSILICCCLAGVLAGQSDVLSIFPNPGYNAQCPDTEITYYIFPWSPVCSAQAIAVGGEIIDQHYYDHKLVVTVIWQAPTNSTSGRIEIQGPDSTCATGILHYGWNFSIISPSIHKPDVSGAEPYFYMGEANSIPLQANLDIGSFIGSPAINFEWEAPAQWKVYSYGAKNELANLDIPLANPLFEGCIRVRCQYVCGSWSDWTDFCLEGIIHSPCPVQIPGKIFLCGDTTERLAYTVGVNFWAPTEYTWTVPSGWSVAGPNPGSQSQALLKPDGHTDGLITVIARAGGFTSPVCAYPVTFLPADPATTIDGPNIVCTTGNFPLIPVPPASAAVTWQVISLDSGVPLVVYPDHGSGAAAFQITDTTVKGYFRIIYKVATACGDVSYSRNFFVGKPLFYLTTLDGAPYLAKPVCAGYHGITTQVAGVLQQGITWSASPGITGYTQRDSFVFSLAAGTGNCPVVTASAGNICGISTLPLTICPQPDCNLPSVDLHVYPNPAYLIVSLETTSADPVSGDHGLIESVEVFNQLGQLVTTWHQPPSNRIIKAVVDLPNGIYILRATVWGQIISRRLVITRLF